MQDRSSLGRYALQGDKQGSMLIASYLHWHRALTTHTFFMQVDVA